MPTSGKINVIIVAELVRLGTDPVDLIEIDLGEDFQLDGRGGLRETLRRRVTAS